MKSKEDVMLGIAAFVIAFLLWFQTQPLFEPGKQLEFAVPLKYEQLDDAKYMAISPPDPVMVVATGTAADLDKLDTSAVVATLDLSRVSPGKNRRPIQISGVNVPSVSVDPRKSSVEVDVEAVEHKTLEVRVQATGSAPTGLLYNGSETEPKKVDVYGPSSYLAKVAQVQVTLRLERLVPGMTDNLPVEVLDSEGKAVSLMKTNPGMVTVKPVSQPAPVTRTVPVNLNWNGSLPRGYKVASVTVEPNQVTVTGTSEKVAMIGGVECEPIDLEGQTDDFSQTVRLIYSDGFESSTKEVKVRVKVVRSRG